MTVTDKGSRKALILLSGGLDSTVCLAQAVKTFGTENVAALSLFYGQKHQRELEAAANVASYYRVRHFTKALDRDIFAGTGSALISGDGVPMPQMTYEEIDAAQGPSPTYVPFRNGNLLSVATAIALQMGAEILTYGAHSEDAHNFAYPDCTPEFIGAMGNAIFIGTYYKVRLVTPLMWMSKADVVKMGIELNAPFYLTHSCYEGDVFACGTCPTCIGRLEAFARNYRMDPIEYRIPNTHRADWKAIFVDKAKVPTDG